jgi:hypothetical protein
MAAELTCVVLDTAAELTELSLDLDHAAQLMRRNQIGIDEARQLEEASALVRAARGNLQALSRAVAALPVLPVTVVRER